MIKLLSSFVVLLATCLLCLKSSDTKMKLVPEHKIYKAKISNSVESSKTQHKTEIKRSPVRSSIDHKVNQIVKVEKQSPEKFTEVGHSQGFHEKVKPFLDKYCVSCHGPKKKKSGLRVDTLSTILNNSDIAEEWQHILDELNGATMPPEDEPQPTATELTDILETLTFEIDQAKKKLYGQNTEIVMRRLNRREYINTVEDLTGVRLKDAEVPLDGKSGAYDTDGKGLFMSSYQFERYMDLGMKVLDKAIFSGSKPPVKTLTIEPEKNRNKTVEKQIQKISKSLKEAKSGNKNAERDLEAYQTYNEIKSSKNGAIITPHLCFSGSRAFFTDLTFSGIRPKDFKPGLYKFTIICGQSNLSKGERALINLDLNYRQKTDKDIINYFEVYGTTENPQKITIEVNLEEYSTFKIDSILKKTGKDIPYVWIDKIEVSGPHFKEWPPASHKKIFGDLKSSSQNASKIIDSFVKKAFIHKKPTDKFMETLMELYNDGIKNGLPLEEAIKEPLAVIMASPKFLYMVEQNKQKNSDLPDFELASRLSYFLWSSKPDNTLMNLAASGKLNHPETLRKQVQRMITDKRSFAFSKGFVPQWLHLNKFDEVDVNQRKYPEFNATVAKNMKLESIHFFDAILKNNLSMVNFIDSDFVTVNNVLKSYYGLDSNGVNDFEVVQLRKDSPRGGLLGMGVVQVMTGNGERTSPVLRGTFVLETLIGTPSPEPPPNVPQLENSKTKNLSIRDALKVHQEQPQCSSCHRRIDPLGFGMENFNAAGKWQEGIVKGKRKKRKLVPMDTKGAMPDGSSYSDIFQQKQELLKYKESFARSLIEAIMGYALGRRVGFSDAQLIDHLVEKSKQNDYKMADIITDIVFSKQFRTK